MFLLDFIYAFYGYFLRTRDQCFPKGWFLDYGREKACRNDKWFKKNNNPEAQETKPLHIEKHNQRRRFDRSGI